MTHKVKHSSDEELPESFTISGFFAQEQAVENTMLACLHRGVPRDLIDVAVSEKAAPHFFGGRAATNRDGWFSWTGRGALAGLLISAVLSLVIVLLPGFNPSKLMAMVQLLGPDIGIIVGAALGALYGWLKPDDIKPQLLRARERNDAVLMLVHLQPRNEAETIRSIFAQLGGEAIRVEADSASSVGSE